MPADTEPVGFEVGRRPADAENAMRKLLGMPSSIGDVTADTERRFSMEQSDGYSGRNSRRGRSESNTDVDSGSVGRYGLEAVAAR